MTTDEAPELPSATILRLEPGDALLFTLPANATSQTVHRIREMADQVFPNHPVVVAIKPTKVTVIRSEEAPA